MKQTLVIFALLCAVAAASVEPGIRARGTILPFSSNVVVGPYRGMQHCFVCDVKEGQVGLVMFSRSMVPATAKAARAIQQEVGKAAKGNMLSWLVFIGKSGTDAEEALEKQVDTFATNNGLAPMNVTALGDPSGPPGYLIGQDAAFTVMVFRNQKVLVSEAWPQSAWNDKTAEQAIQKVASELKL
ncbi:MAG: hypothetical protein ACYCW6_26795 [Candidatus Xenobia bacterium]